MTIPFNIPFIAGSEQDSLRELFSTKKFCGDGGFTVRCHEMLEQSLGCKKALLTTSCTHALEMAALLCNIAPGDEVIMPSFTFVSTANPFVLRGARIIFVDVRPDTMNLDEARIEAAITSRTKAIVPVHYAGVACDMDRIMEIAAAHQLWVIEDAAQAIGATYKGQPLGTIGHLGCLSFHETKNIHCGEGGALIINHEAFVQRAEIIREKGTNRSRFLRGQVDKYSWVDVGSSYLPSELNAAFLTTQLAAVPAVTRQRLQLWEAYYARLSPMAEAGQLEVPVIPEGCAHNGHMFYIKLGDIEQRQALIQRLKDNGIQSVFHYIPLHSADAGKVYGAFRGDDVYTTKDSERLLRLPMYYDLTADQVDTICDAISMN